MKNITMQPSTSTKRKFPEGTLAFPTSVKKSLIDKEEISKQRKNLPIFTAKHRFLEQVKQNDCVVLIGETGSGKTTQVPQFIQESGLNCKLIGITQPRRVAAISLSQRVEHESGSESKVGYRVRFEDTTGPDTKIVYQTDGMLLRESMIDPLLSKYSWIILDEAHERTVNTDILFGVLKSAQDKRTSEDSLKIIVMSATMDALKFSEYFRHCPILYVIGRQHPVNIRHVTDTKDDWLTAVMETIMKIHMESPVQEDILAFLTGQDEIESVAQTLKSALQHQDQDANLGLNKKALVMPLYAALQVSSQQKVFLPAKSGTRKIILATNIAETSITIPGIKHVIDSCRVKAKVHQASTGLDILRVVKISQAQAAQRAGRAGRDSEGNCYRMLTRQEFQRLDSETVPEIKRCAISTVLLQMLSIGIENIFKFDFLDPPPEDAVEGALRQLELLGAIECNEEQNVRLTNVGKQLAIFPLDPKFTKAILAAKELGCTEEVITIVSMLTGDSPILTPNGKRSEALAARVPFTSSEGDHIFLLKIYRAFSKTNSEKEFCQAHYLHRRHLQFAVEVRKQLIELCQRHKIPVQSCVNHTELVRKALAQGMFTNVARLTRDGHYVTLDSKQKVQIHPSSVMFKGKPELVLFTELIATQKSYIRTLSLVDASWLQEAQPAYFRQHRIIQGS